MKTALFAIAFLFAGVAVHALPQDTTQFLVNDNTESNFPEPELDENGIPVGMALVDGDILIPKEQLPIYEKEGFDGLVKSDAWLNGPLWPTKTIGVGIDIQDPVVVRKIIDSMIDLNNKQSCLKFHRIYNPIPQRHIVFRSGQSCYTMIGPVTPGSAHDIFLHAGCTSERTPAHEVMHALGRFHEQTRPDRDRYITVNWNRIRQDCKSQYRRQDRALTLGLPYDYYSVMHYSPRSCSIGGATMTFPHGVNVNNVGREAWLTQTDISHINKRYCPRG